MARALVNAAPRALVIAALLGAIVACVGALLGGGVATREAATHSMASRSLTELAQLAGLADERGTLLREEPLAVEVIADGGPLWVIPAIERAVEASPWFAVGRSPHLLRAEIIEEQGGIALQLHLWRSGWELREPDPRRIRVAGWAPVVAGLFGALVALALRRLDAGLATSGVFAQLLLAIDPLPPELFPPQRLTQAWADGPLGGVIASIQTLGPLETALAAAVLAASLVLVAFDHRRSRERSATHGSIPLGRAGLAAALGSFGAVAWIEAAARGSLLAACDLRFGAWAGLLALAGLIVAWLPAIRLAREVRRAHS
jgi:hypothetical protein